MKSIDEYMLLPYRMEIIPDAEEGGYVVSFPALKGCLTCADTLERVSAAAEEAKRAWFSAAIEEGYPIPEPEEAEYYSGQFKLRIPKTLHKELVMQARREGISMNQYCVHLLSRNGDPCAAESCSFREFGRSTDVSAKRPTEGEMTVMSEYGGADSVLKEKYEKAQMLLTEGKLEQAVRAFSEIENYLDCSKYVTYIKAMQLAENGQYDLAVPCFRALGEFKDSSLMAAYYTARGYEAGRRYKEAEETFRTVLTFRDSDQRLKMMKLTAQRAWRTVGSAVNFGRYEQGDGVKDIEWQVLEVRDDRALIISKNALDCKPYNEELREVTWESCTLRRWLNGEFMNKAFNEEEQARIPLSWVPAHRNPKCDTDPGNDTRDMVFLLSIEEAEKYFEDDEARRAAPTAYAVRQGAYTTGGHLMASEEAACCWWLRSPGGRGFVAACVFSTGSVFDTGGGVHSSENAVRPALWVKL